MPPHDDAVPPIESSQNGPSSMDGVSLISSQEMPMEVSFRSTFVRDVRRIAIRCSCR